MSSILITKLRPFIIICQIYGLIPFSMEMDPIAGGFQRFTCSLKNFVTWWYAFVLVVQIICYLISMVFGMKYVTDAEEIGVSPTVLKLTAATQLLYMVQIFCCRIVVLKLKRLRRVITLIHEVEHHLKEVLENSKDSILLRVILGVLFVAIMVNRAYYKLISMLFRMLQIIIFICNEI